MLTTNRGSKRFCYGGEGKTKQQPVSYVVEATGVYHEQLAVFLYDKSVSIAVIQPNRSHNHTRTLQMKTVTDLTAAVVIADYGLRHNPEAWIKPEPVYLELRSLGRERAQLLEDKVRLENQLHAMEHSAHPVKQTIKRMMRHLHFIQQQIKQIEEELHVLPEHHTALQEGMARLTSIPGVGSITAQIIIGETLGFHGFTSAKQVVSYAGLDVVKKESGTSIRGKGHISKRGNKNLRLSLHYPALVAVRYNETHKQFLIRITTKTGVKMKGYVAVQRKILVLAFELWKNKTYFDPNYIP